MGNIRDKTQRTRRMPGSKIASPSGWTRNIHVARAPPVALQATPKSAILPIYSGHPALRPLGQHCETMLFKIIPDDFVSNRGSHHLKINIKKPAIRLVYFILASPRRRSTNPVVKGSSEFIISNNKLRRKKA